MVGYGLSLVYQFTNPAETLGGHGEPDGPRRAGVERPGGDRSCCSWRRRCSRSSRRSWSAPSSTFIDTLRAVVLLRRRRAHPDHRQPRRAPRGRPARGEGQDGVRDGRDLRVEPAGRAVRRAGPRPPRRR